MPMKLLGITNVDSGVIEQRLFKFSISGRYWRKMRVEWHGTSAVYRFQENLRLSQEGSIIQYSN
jgi:hypothetical protein